MTGQSAVDTKSADRRPLSFATLDEAVAEAERDQAALATMIRHAREAALRRFGMECHADSVMDVYESVLAEAMS